MNYPKKRKYQSGGPTTPPESYPGPYKTTSNSLATTVEADFNRYSPRATAARQSILSIERNKALQKEMKEKGYYSGAIDGIIGPKTRAALTEYNLAEKGLVLPEFEVISATTPAKRNTLYALQQAEKVTPGVFRVWENSNKPHISPIPSTSTVPNPHYNPYTNTITLDTQSSPESIDAWVDRELASGNSSLERFVALKKKHEDYVNDRSKDRLTKEEYEYYHNTISAFNNNPDRREVRNIRYATILTELPHSRMQAGVGRFIADWHKRPYFTEKQRKAQYSTQGTHEYEAHRVIEPIMRAVAATTPKNYTIDPGSPNERPLKMKQQPATQNTGGFLPGLLTAINPIAGAISTGLGLVGSISQLFNKDRGPATGSPGNYKTGGQMRDIALSGGAFQVKGNPSTTDGNFYPQHNAYLDHNEVVKNNFVFSDKLRSPINGKKFSEEALVLEKSTAKARKKLRINPTDPHAKATVEANERSSAQLAALQEVLATRMGYRDVKGNTVQRMENGGPLPWENFNVQAFQSWYNRHPIPASNTTWKPLTVDNVWGPKTEAAFNQYGSTYRNVAFAPASQDPSGKALRYWQDPGYDDPSNYGLLGHPTMTQSQIDALMPPAQTMGPNPAYGGPTSTDERAQTVQSFITPEEEQSMSMGISAPQTETKERQRGDFTFGDYLQLGALAGQAIPLFGGPERVRPHLDNTQLRKQSYDPSQALYQNQRNFSNIASTINTPSETLRRALLNQLNASKVNQDQRVVTQYQEMNQRAQTDYENRLSNRQRFNAQQLTQVDDLNARNRAAYRGAVQNAFQSISNLGMAFNERDMQQKQLNLLQARYGDVYDRILTTLMQDGRQ